ncbi:MAG TPA: response regulator [Labilithrix sp.]|nr:response regulator [Labilithrix sp.]
MDTVLVVDDDPDFRELIRLCIEGEGLRVLLAADCAQGLSTLRKERERVALVLLDYWMPNMRPCQCAARIIATVHPKTRIVLVTAAVDAAARAAEVGLSEWLAKPFELERLQSIVVDVQSARGAR